MKALVLLLCVVAALLIAVNGHGGHDGHDHHHHHDGGGGEKAVHALTSRTFAAELQEQPVTLVEFFVSAERSGAQQAAQQRQQRAVSHPCSVSLALRLHGAVTARLWLPTTRPQLSVWPATAARLSSPQWTAQ
jgi:hypothetical protein